MGVLGCGEVSDRCCVILPMSVETYRIGVEQFDRQCLQCEQ